MTAAGPVTRFRLGFFVRMQNVTNHVNYGGYSGTLTSPFFGQPTMVSTRERSTSGSTSGSERF
jgi:hypothetical protein